MRVKRAEESRDERTDGSYAEAAPWFVVEHFSSHLAGAAYNFRRWPSAGRSLRVFLPSVYFLNGRNNKLSQPPSRVVVAGHVGIYIYKSAAVNRAHAIAIISRNRVVPRVVHNEMIGRSRGRFKFLDEEHAASRLFWSLSPRAFDVT